jgi:hypothetical protein
MTMWSVFGFAAGGGLVVSVLSLTATYSVPKVQRPDTFTDPIYVVKFFGHPVVGAFLAFVLFKSLPCVVNEIAAFIVGATATQIVDAVLKSGLGVKLFLQGDAPRSDVEGG